MAILLHGDACKIEENFQKIAINIAAIIETVNSSVIEHNK